MSRLQDASSDRLERERTSVSQLVFLYVFHLMGHVLQVKHRRLN